MLPAFRSAALACALFAGCGRVSFDAIGDAGDSDGPTDADTGLQTLIVGSASGNPGNVAGTFDVIRPSGSVEGDELYVAIYMNQLATFPDPPGWNVALNQLDNTAMFRACFLDRVVGPTEPTSYTFSVTSSNVAWGAVAVRPAPGPQDAGVSTLVSGAPSSTFVTYTTPEITATRPDRLLAMFIDDSGSTGTAGWGDPAPGTDKLLDARRVAAFTSVAGPGTLTMMAVVNVPGTTTPHGAVRVLAWPR